MKSFGGIAFIIGLILAIIVSILGAEATPVWAILILGLLGLIVGIFNVTDKEVMTFLVAAIAFMISFSALSNLFTLVTFGWTAISTFFSLINVFIAPATAIVAIKALYEIAKE
ncbi:MAG: hypothetical protein ACQER9_01330 [Nanobdellota archaeon]